MIITRQEKGITLIALVVTIIVLLILAGVSIGMLTGENGILTNAKKSKAENNKQTATEKMNIKITEAQIETYTKEQRMPTLQELADYLCEDKNDEIQYVTTSTQIASVDKISIGEAKSIFTKLKEYPYEFEINRALQLASIDGIKISNIPSTDNDSIVSMTKKELENFIDNRIKSQSTITPSTGSNTIYSEDEKVIGTWIDGKSIYRKVYNFGTIAANSTARISISDIYSSIEQVIDIRGTAYCPKFSQWYGLPNTHTDMPSYYINPLIEGSDSDLTVRVGSGFERITNVIVILEYTKTTDSSDN